MICMHRIQAFLSPFKTLTSKLHIVSTHSSRLHAATKPLVNANELLDKMDVFIFDCDGVIWKGDSLIDKVPSVLDKLRQLGKTIFFVTNNSTKSRKGYLKKFTGLGLSVKPEGMNRERFGVNESSCNIMKIYAYFVVMYE